MRNHASKVRLEVDASDISNILSNHSGQSGSTGWVGETGITVASVTDPTRGSETLLGTYTGGYAIKATHTGVMDSRVLSPSFTVAAGAQVGCWFSVADSRVVVVGSELCIQWGFVFYDAGAAVVSSSGIGTLGWKLVDVDDPWRMAEFSAGMVRTVPAGAVSARMFWKFRDWPESLQPTVSRDVYLSKVMVVTSAGANASTKVRSVPFSEGTIWQDILGSATSAKIRRGGQVEGCTDKIEAGTMTATVTDPIMDPAQNARMRVGRNVRLTALDETTGEHRALFTGRVDKLDVAYADKYDPTGSPSVTLTAVDAVAELAKTTQPFNYAGAYGPKVKAMMAASSVPYVADAGSASTDINHRDRDEGKLWDQLVLARNTYNGARLWVDTEGTLNAVTVSPDGVPDLEFHDRQRWPFTNLVTNPSYEVNTTGTSKTVTPTSIARSSGWAEQGSWSLLVTGTSATTGLGLRTATAHGSETRINLTPGDYFSMRAAVKALKANMTFEFQVFESAGGVPVGSTRYLGTVATVGVGDEAVVEFAHEQTADPTADRVEAYLIASFASTTGDLCYVDGWAVIHEGATPAEWDTVPYADTTGTWEPTGTPYTGADVNFGSGTLVNELMIVANNDGEAEGRKEYGPYVNAVSQADWGVSPATVHAVDPSSPSALAETYLERFADPSIFPRTVTYRAVDAVAGALFVDVYDQCRVIHGPSGTDAVVPALSVEHVITPKRWDVTLGFRPETSTAVTVSNPAAGDDTGPTDVYGAIADTFAVCSSNLTCSTSSTDVTGQTLTVNVSSDTAVYLVTVTCDVSTLTTGGGTFIADLYVDGVAASGSLLWAAGATSSLRNTLTRRYRVTGVTPGSRVFKVQARGTVASVYRVNTTHSTIGIEQKN